jgi:hypothetical protein
MKYAPTLTPPDDDIEPDINNWPPRGIPTDVADRKRIEKLYGELLATRRKLAASLALKFSPHIMASLATVGLAISQVEAVLNEKRSSSV